MYYVPQDIPRLSQAYHISDRETAILSNDDMSRYFDAAREHYALDMLCEIYRNHAIKTYDEKKHVTTVSIDVCILPWSKILEISRESYARGQRDGASWCPQSLSKEEEGSCLI